MVKGEEEEEELIITSEEEGDPKGPQSMQLQDSDDEQVHTQRGTERHSGKGGQQGKLRWG